MITHIFYHQETVEQSCAVNSWQSIRDWFGPDDEVIVLDVGVTLKGELPLTRPLPHLRYERLVTTCVEEKSYTYGLNKVMPTALGEWVFLWRSDYIYHERSFPAVLLAIQSGDYSAVLPYEAMIGAYYAKGGWCRPRLDFLRHAPEEELLAHASVCPIYQIGDFAHFAIRRDLWIECGGMDARLWGYNCQFSELFHRLRSFPAFKPFVSFDYIAFHQAHQGSYGNKVPTPARRRELLAAHQRLVAVCGSEAAVDTFNEECRRPPLRPRWPAERYLSRHNPLLGALLQLPGRVKRRLRQGMKPATGMAAKQ